MVTKFFSRMFDAVQSNEKDLIDQVQKDLGTAQDKGKIDTNQLTYNKDKGKDGTIQVVDKVNNETTEVNKTDNGYKITSDDQSYLLPQIATSVDELKKEVDSLKKEESPNASAEKSGESKSEDEPKSEPKTEESKSDEPKKDEPSTKESEGDKDGKTKTESATDPEQKVSFELNGKEFNGILMGDAQNGMSKVKITNPGSGIPKAILVPKSSIKFDSNEEPKGLGKDVPLRFSKKSFSSAVESFYIVDVDSKGNCTNVLAVTSSMKSAINKIKSDKELKDKFSKAKIDILAEKMVPNKFLKK